MNQHNQPKANTRTQYFFQPAGIITRRSLLLFKGWRTIGPLVSQALKSFAVASANVTAKNGVKKYKHFVSAVVIAVSADAFSFDSHSCACCYSGFS